MRHPACLDERPHLLLKLARCNISINHGALRMRKGNSDSNPILFGLLSVQTPRYSRAPSFHTFFFCPSLPSHASFNHHIEKQENRLQWSEQTEERPKSDMLNAAIDFHPSKLPSFYALPPMPAMPESILCMFDFLHLSRAFVLSRTPKDHRKPNLL